MREITKNQMKQLDEWFAANRQMVETLGRYNSERSHGLMHTPEWQAQMEAFQKTYDDHLREFAG